jgi:hypothetical protein
MHVAMEDGTEQAIIPRGRRNTPLRESQNNRRSRKAGKNQDDSVC